MIQIKIRNMSSYKHAYNSRRLRRIAEAVLNAEGYRQAQYELSLVFCDNDIIQPLNKIYRGKDMPTDVLSFSVPSDFPIQGVKPLGEIIISLQTVLERTPDFDKAKKEIELLFCHGLLHLLGYTHDTKQQREQMIIKQAEYLGIPRESAWIKYPKHIKRER